MTVDDLLEEMFPGDKELNLCAFSALGLRSAQWMDAECLETIVTLLRELGDTFQGKTEVNTILKTLRTREPEAMRQFTISALEAYFSAPAIIMSLKGGPATLFPNQRVLPEIDFDLLEPVLENCEAGDV